ncbi:type IV pilin protein [Dyella acidisoli]|uniref:Prepilin-type N-terminal cleavage/methylation domain-containing protein n=1 Tax=Dyella acidisoli TaxID=1867834 RepID=A0ABQ5XR31_9GAMM|nr:prepilin-type N-terminal cleavage/methylation domain-containing protein [Dyella acidisoli]GLQ94184.1 hypothetical protein GCM10007901_31350 [Dyella acidisoli]
MKGTRLQRGFTLIELMVVIAIIAILAVIAMNAYGNYITRSKVQAAKADMIALSLSLENELQRNLVYGTHNFSSTAEITSIYTTWSPSQKNSFTYSLSSGATQYTIKATGISGSLSTCVLTFDSTATGGISGSCGSVTTW